MRHYFTLSLALSALTIFLTFCSYEARADFSIIPVTVSLTPQKATTLLTLHNTGAKEVRLQLSVFKWEQTPKGKMTLTPSDDVVFYPPIVTVGANEDRIIRVGSTVPFGLTEKAYRVIAEELPPPPEHQTAVTGVQTKVVVLTKLSIPVFMVPPNYVHSQSLSGATLQNGQLSFQAKNDGNSHITVGHASVNGFAGADKTVFHRSTLQGGYILAGEYQIFDLNIPSPECQKIRKIAIQVPIGEPMGEYDVKTDTLKAELNVTPDMCAGAGPGGRKGSP